MRHTTSFLKSIFLLLISLMLSGSLTAASLVQVGVGAGQFTFIDNKGRTDKPIEVFTYLPKTTKAETAPIVFVMHGHGKDANVYRDTWIPEADKYGFMVIAPKFDTANWAQSYAVGDVMKDAREAWSFNVIEHLFDAVKTATNNPAPKYFLYGHSEGGQFVHRLVWFLPEARYAKAVAANPGWYTMPSFSEKFPYGFSGAPVTTSSVKQSFARDLTLMLGEKDTDPNHPALRKTAEAMAQGAYRFARGQAFFKTAKLECEAIKCDFAWKLQTVPNAAHSNEQMASAAAAVLMSK